MIKGIGKVIKLLMSCLVTVVLIGACLFVYARYIEPKLLKTEYVTVEAKDLSLKQPIKIAFFTDTHLGEYYSFNDLQKVVDKINAMSPDLIIFGGDLVEDNKTFEDEQGAITVLSRLQAPCGKYAVYGNHDHGGNGTKRYARIMKASGFSLLFDGHKEIQIQEQTISLIGIDDIVLGSPDIKQAFEGVPKNSYRLFISHAPDVANSVKAYDVDLQLSGHTHGGQVSLPFIGSPMTPPYGKEYIKGLYDIEDTSMQLYVSSGIGTSQLPFRFLNIPEVTLITLTS